MTKQFLEMLQSVVDLEAEENTELAVRFCAEIYKELLKYYKPDEALDEIFMIFSTFAAQDNKIACKEYNLAKEAIYYQGSFDDFFDDVCSVYGQDSFEEVEDLCGLNPDLKKRIVLLGALIYSLDEELTPDEMKLLDRLENC